MSGKIIKIDGETVTIGLDDGSCRIVTLKELGFRAVIGDEVDIYVNDGETIYFKKSSNLMDNGSKNFIVIGSTKRVNKFVYLVLIFFLGWIGIHKFYAGRIFEGFIYVIFSWTFLPALCALIEFIIVLFKKSDPYGNIFV